MEGRKTSVRDIFDNETTFLDQVIVNLPDEYYAKGFAKGYEKYTQTQRLEQCM